MIGKILLVVGIAMILAGAVCLVGFGIYKAWLDGGLPAAAAMAMVSGIVAAAFGMASK